MSNSHLRTLLLTLLFAMPACAMDEPTPDESPVTDDTVFTETIVHVQADGTLAIGEPHEITAGEQRAQNAYREQLEAGAVPLVDATLDGSCAPSDVWIYDRTDFTGNRICFAANTTAVAYFSEYIRGTYPFIATWRISSGSVWPGVAPGLIRRQPLAPDPNYWSVSWNAWGARFAFVEPAPAYMLVLYPN